MMDRGASTRRTIVTTSWDDGHPLDRKVGDLLADLGLAGTFYISPRNRERRVMQRSAIVDLSQGFEIGAHTLTHPDLRMLRGQQLTDEVGGGKQELEHIIGRPVDVFCYPRGKRNARVLRAVMNAGFAGARTTLMLRTDSRWPAWSMPTTIYAKAYPMWMWYRHCAKYTNLSGLARLLGIGVSKPWFIVARRYFEAVMMEGGIWHLWGHSWEVEQDGLWRVLRELLQFVSGHRSVLYLTNGELLRMRCERRGPEASTKHVESPGRR